MKAISVMKKLSTIREEANVCCVASLFRMVRKDLTDKASLR